MAAADDSSTKATVKDLKPRVTDGFEGGWQDVAVSVAALADARILRLGGQEMRGPEVVINEGQFLMGIYPNSTPKVQGVSGQ